MGLGEDSDVEAHSPLACWQPGERGGLPPAPPRPSPTPGVADYLFSSVGLSWASDDILGAISFAVSPLPTSKSCFFSFPAGEEGI